MGELPAQVDALTPDTALVTITIGGNDVGYLGGLIAGSCTNAPTVGTSSTATAQPLCQMIAAGRRSGGAMPTPTEEAWTKVETALAAITQETRRRAPNARIIFVEYLTVLPEGPLCAQATLSPAAVATGRTTATRLARLTEEVAKRSGVEVLNATALSKNHSACAAAPWVAGFIPPPNARSFVPYHPNLAGMTAVAEALDQRLKH